MGTPQKTAFISAEKWEDMTPAERSKVIKDSKNKTENKEN